MEISAGVGVDVSTGGQSAAHSILSDYSSGHRDSGGDAHADDAGWLLLFVGPVGARICSLASHLSGQACRECQCRQ